MHKIGDLVAAVDQLAGDGLELALVEHIAVDIADFCNARDNAGAVRAAQSAVDLIFLVERGVKCGICTKLVT